MNINEAELLYRYRNQYSSERAIKILQQELLHQKMGVELRLRIVDILLKEKEKIKEIKEPIDRKTLAAGYDE